MCTSQRPDEKICCIGLKQVVVVETPKKLILFKNIHQFWCLDYRIGFPCDDEVPCVWFYCPGCSCCANCRPGCFCCASIETMTGGSRRVDPSVNQQQQQQSIVNQQIALQSQQLQMQQIQMNQQQQHNQVMQQIQFNQQQQQQR